jgi:hypothetical protein
VINILKISKIFTDGILVSHVSRYSTHHLNRHHHVVAFGSTEMGLHILDLKAYHLS